MSITIEIEIRRDFAIDGPYDKVFDLLADVPASASHFPKLEKLTDLGDNTFRWEMDKVGVDKYSIQTSYACKYVSDKDAGTISWTPVEGEGNSRVSGRWKIKADGDNRTQLSFQTEAELTLPFPKLMKMAISPVIKHEFNGVVDQYVKNLQNAFA